MLLLLVQKCFLAWPITRFQGDCSHDLKYSQETIKTIIILTDGEPATSTVLSSGQHILFSVSPIQLPKKLLCEGNSLKQTDFGLVSLGMLERHFVCVVGALFLYLQDIYC